MFYGDIAKLIVSRIGLLILPVFLYFKPKSLQGELWGWTCFFIGVAAVAIGSSYYHLKPNDARLVWDRLPVSFFLQWKNPIILENVGC